MRSITVWGPVAWTLMVVCDPKAYRKIAKALKIPNAKSKLTKALKATNAKVQPPHRCVPLARLHCGF